MTDDLNTFCFLVTTDNHLGFMEKDLRRGPDSFVTFEECLRAARVIHNVDCMLLAGDLFHENKPSLLTLNRTITLLRRYVMGDKLLNFSMCSDPAIIFPRHPVPCANFQDPNLNIALPIFTINGNHDDPVGSTSAIDILSSSGLMNYFGVVDNLEEIVLHPILLKKGTTKIALYGMGNVRDERLYRCFEMKKITFVKPKSTGNTDWFSILLLHQNRGVRTGTSKSGIKESMFREYGLDLVIWGNEHEQLMMPQNTEGVDVVQPGSSIMTSLSTIETNSKQYGILEVRGNEYRIRGFDLLSVRPMVAQTVELFKDNPNGRTREDVESYLNVIAAELLTRAEGMAAKIPPDVLSYHPNVRFPLMRIYVDAHDPEGTNYPLPNPNRFGINLLDRVVNADDVLKPIKSKGYNNGFSGKKRSYTAGTGNNLVDVEIPAAPQNLSTSDIRSKIANVLSNNSKDACQLLSEAELGNALFSFVEKCEKDSLEAKVAELLVQGQKYTYKKIKGLNPKDALKVETVHAQAFNYKKELNTRFMLEQKKEESEHKPIEHVVDNILGSPVFANINTNEKIQYHTPSNNLVSVLPSIINDCDEVLPCTSVNTVYRHEKYPLLMPLKDVSSTPSGGIVVTTAVVAQTGTKRKRIASSQTNISGKGEVESGVKRTVPVQPVLNFSTSDCLNMWKS